MVIRYSARGDSFTADKPRVWSETLLVEAPIRVYDLAPDGKRFAAILYADGTDQKPFTHLTVLLNFFDELKRRLPAGGQ